MADVTPTEFDSWGKGAERASYATFAKYLTTVIYVDEAPHCPGVTFPLDDARNKGKARG